MTSTTIARFVGAQWHLETVNPYTKEMVTISIFDVNAQRFMGRIGDVSGEFAWGQQEDAPWVWLHSVYNGITTDVVMIEDDKVKGFPVSDSLLNVTGVRYGFSPEQAACQHFDRYFDPGEIARLRKENGWFESVPVRVDMGGEYKTFHFDADRKSLFLAPLSAEDVLRECPVSGDDEFGRDMALLFAVCKEMARRMDVVPDEFGFSIGMGNFEPDEDSWEESVISSTYMDGEVRTPAVSQAVLRDLATRLHKNIDELEKQGKGY